MESGGGWCRALFFCWDCPSRDNERRKGRGAIERDGQRERKRKREGGRQIKTELGKDVGKHCDAPYCSGTKPVVKQSRVNSGSRVQTERTRVCCYAPLQTCVIRILFFFFLKQIEKESRGRQDEEEKK